MYPEELNDRPSHQGSMAERLTQAFCHAASSELADSLRMIEHCLSQLEEEQIWHRGEQSLNAIGNLILHLLGNLRQWVVAGLGGAADIRERPREFAPCEPIPARELLAAARSCVHEAATVLSRLDPENMLQMRRIQGFEMTGVAALWHSVSHFRGHTQEIIRLTRQHLGQRYRFAWAPRTLEEGADAADRPI